MTALIQAHPWLAVLIAFVLGVAVVSAIALRLDGGPEDPADQATRRRWFGDW